MEKVNYTITLDDCSDYVKYQLKIKRIRKFVMKSFIPFWIIGLILAIVTALPFILDFLGFFKYVMSENDLSFIQALIYKDTLLGVWSYFWTVLGSIMPLVIIWVVIFGIALTMYRFDPFHALSKKVYKMLQGGALDAELEVKDDGIYAEGKGQSSVMKWDGLIDIYDTGKTFLVFVSDYRAVIVPKRAFKTEETAQEFFNFVNEKLENCRSHQ